MGHFVNFALLQDHLVAARALWAHTPQPVQPLKEDEELSPEERGMREPSWGVLLTFANKPRISEA